MVQFDYQTVFIAQLVAATLAALILRWWQGLIAVFLVTLAGLSALGWLDDLNLEVFGLALVPVLSLFLIVFFAKQLVVFALHGWPQAIASSLIAVIAVSAGAVAFGGYVPMLAPAFLRNAAHDAVELLSRQCSAARVREVALPALPRFAAISADVEILTAVPTAHANAPVAKYPETWDHFIGPWRSIRVADISAYPNPDPYDSVAVTMTVVVGDGGAVLAALPTSGPSQLYADAVRIAKAWRYVPFVRDGKPAIVQIPDIPIPVAGAEKRPAARTPFPQADLDTVSVRLTMEPSFWGGPRYEVAIRGDGAVTYDGSAGVALTGRHCATIARASVERLVDEFRQAEFFWLEDRYTAQMTDQPARELSITIGGQTKSVYDYGSGWLAETPDALHNLPTLVLHTAGASRWTRGNDLTVPSLKAENWDFANSGEANRYMVAGVAAFGEAGALRALIAAGAPIASAGHPHKFSPLEIAAMRGEPGMVRALLAANHRWSRDELTITLLAAAKLGDAAAVEGLLSRGADINAHEPPRLSSKTPLMIAADAGVPEVVELMLRFKPDIRAVDEAGRPALHWAANWHNANAPPLQGIDRVKVLDLLIKAGSDVNARDNEQRTALFDWWVSDENVAAALIARGINVNVPDIDGATALMHCKNPNVTLMMLKAGADPYLKDKDGKDALAHTSRAGTEWAAVATVLTQWIAAHPQKPAAAR